MRRHITRVTLWKICTVLHDGIVLPFMNTEKKVLINTLLLRIIETGRWKTVKEPQNIHQAAFWSFVHAEFLWFILAFAYSYGKQVQKYGTRNDSKTLQRTNPFAIVFFLSFVGVVAVCVCVCFFVCLLGPRLDVTSRLAAMLFLHTYHSLHLPERG